MIWEVDEDHDGCVGWTEFERAFLRCEADKAGTEPRQLHDVILFALHLAGETSRLTAEQATRLLYLQYGRVSSDMHALLVRTSPARFSPADGFFCVQEALEEQLVATFGSTSISEGGDLTLEDFLGCMRERHLRRGPQRQQRCKPAPKPS